MKSEMTQDEINTKVLQTNGSVAEILAIGATADQLRACAEWISRQPGYYGKLVKSRSKADKMLGPSWPYEHVTESRALCSAIGLAAASIR